MTAPTTIFEVSAPASGNWRIDVVPLDPDKHAVEVVAYDSSGGVSKASATGTGAGGRYSAAYSAAPGAPIVLSGIGGADGGSGSDGGAGVPDAGTVGGSGPPAPPARSGGGCGTAGAGNGVLIVLAVLLLLRWKRRTVASRPARVPGWRGGARTPRGT
jgi:hypothetical protein